MHNWCCGVAAVLCCGSGAAANAAGKLAGEAAAQTWCTPCHALPRPTAKPARAWPNVVVRMNQHRLARGLGGIPPTEMSAITAYLQQNASRP